MKSRRSTDNGIVAGDYYCGGWCGVDCYCSSVCRYGDGVVRSRVHGPLTPLW